MLFMAFLGSKGPRIKGLGGCPKSEPLGFCPTGPRGGGPLMFGGRALWDIRGGGMLCLMVFYKSNKNVEVSK